MSFDPKDKDHKAQLYRAIVAAAEMANERFDDFLQRPFNPPWALAANYRRNLQRGDYSTIRAKVLYDFILAHHFDAGHREAPDIFPETPAMRWRSILDQQAIEGRLRIVPVASSFGVVERDSDLKAAGTTIKLGQRFCLELESTSDGHAIALQGLRDQWHPIPLGPKRALSKPVREGTNRLPQLADGTLDPLSENRDLGLHEFVLIAASTAAIPATIERLVIWVSANPCEIHQFTVQII